ncbi:MAG: DNA methyltransferase, partial [Acidobacteriota bacterium]
MPPGRKPPRLPRPHTTLETPRGTLRFFLGDCLEVLAALPRRSVSVMVTSPPYNLGIRYRTYDDTLPRAGYLEWTGRWVAAAREVLDTEG